MSLNESPGSRTPSTGHGAPAAPPLVSIGLPVYNGERFVEKAVRSLLAQTFTNFELIISDNASTDATPAICRRLADEDCRIRFVLNERNIGAAANFNRVLALGTGRYFKWACADDWSAPTLVERCVQTLESRPEVVLCFGHVSVVDEAETLHYVHADGLDLQSPSVCERFFVARAHHGMLNALQGLMRIDVLKKMGLMKSFYGSDAVLVAELSLWGPFVELPEMLLYRRLHDGGGRSLKTDAERAEHLDPRRRNSPTLVRWREHWEHFKSVSRCPATLRVKMQLLDIVGRSMFWCRAELAAEALGAWRSLWLRRSRSV